MNGVDCEWGKRKSPNKMRFVVQGSNMLTVTRLLPLKSKACDYSQLTQVEVSLVGDTHDINFS